MGVLWSKWAGLVALTNQKYGMRKWEWEKRARRANHLDGREGAPTPRKVKEWEGFCVFAESGRFWEVGCGMQVEDEAPRTNKACAGVTVTPRLHGGPGIGTISGL